ncbi:MAG: CBS domain-containing protein, partial [Armatimonadia bacterium]|nr:CBS domain-containing protein [Armatimonadia bacterium]
MPIAPVAGWPIEPPRERCPCAANSDRRHLGGDGAGGDFVVARDVMLTDLISLHGDGTVRQAIGLMLSEKIREIPVVDDQQHLVGTVRDDGLVSLAMPSYSEMLVDMSYIPDDFEPFERRLRSSADLPINAVMRQDFITVSEDTSVI